MGQKKPFRVVLKFEVGGGAWSYTRIFVKRATSRSEAHQLVSRVRGAFRSGSWVIPGNRLLYARIYDERRASK